VFLDHVVPQPDSTVSLANRLQGLGQHLSLMERLGLLEKGNITDANIREELSGQLHVDEEEDEELLAALTSIQDILVCSDSFQQLASDLRKSLYRDSSQEMELIRDCVTDELPLGSPYSTTFDVDWNLLEFMHTQYDGIVSLASTVTITGSALYAQATTCGEYVRKNWPRNGPRVLKLLEEALKHPGKEISDSDIGLSYWHLHLHTYMLDCQTCRPSIRLRMETRRGGAVSILSTDEKDTVELAQLLAWVGAALSSSPFGDKLAYAKPTVTAAEPAHAPKGTGAAFSITYEYASLHVTENTCWLSLFTGAAIATGFPIPDRGGEFGLEIPLQLLAGIAGVCHATEFNGGLVMKGYRHMFWPVQKMDDRIQWHVVASQDRDTYLSYGDVLTGSESRASLQDVGFDDLRSTRVFLGWCSSAISRLGSDKANYENIDYSGSPPVSSEMHCSGGQLGFSQFVTGSVSVTFGRKEGTCHQQCGDRYPDIVSRADKALVVLYDTHEQRGALVNASDVILHFIQDRHYGDPFMKDGQRVALNTNVPVGASAKGVLLQHEKITYWSALEPLLKKTEELNQIVKIKGTFRESLQGYEFKSIVDQSGTYKLVETEKQLAATHGGWPNLVRDMDALVLLADGFGEIILPAPEDKLKLCADCRGCHMGRAI
jgi:hypothetical protein